MSAERLAEAIRQEAEDFEDFIALETWVAEMMRRAAESKPGHSLPCPYVVLDLDPPDPLQ